MLSFVPFVVTAVRGLREIAPTVPDYIGGGAVAWSALAGCWSIACFFLCPRRPLAPKLTTCFLTIPAVYLAFYFGSIYYVYGVAFPR